MNIKSSIIAISFIALGFAKPNYAVSSFSNDFKTQLQNIVDTYYKTHNDKEKFTAIAASVLIPKGKNENLEDIMTFVSGTIGFPPLNQPITVNNLFDIGSITKSFTALILLQLQTEGILSLNDTVGKWLPQYPQWSKVTLRQLFNMTSGIPNYSENPIFLKKMEDNLSLAWTNEELLAYAHPEKPLAVNKTNRFEYCNSNYLLAALVIEKATKDSYENQLNKRIINQKDYLKNTFYPAGPDGSKIKDSIISRQVHGYYYDKKTKKNVDTINNNLTWAGAAGAIVANTDDVTRWVQILYHGLFIKPSFRESALAELETVVSMKTGKPIATVTKEDPAGFGLGVGYYYDKESKQRFWVYKGSTLGFRVMYFWQPCNDVTTVVALNSKAGEGDPDSSLGDDIVKPNLDLYKEIMKHYPELNCEINA